MISKTGLGFVTKSHKTKLVHTDNNYFANLLSANQTQKDSIEINPSKKVISFSGNNFEYKQNKNVINLISFTGLQNPQKQQPIGIQMRVVGVTKYQTNMIEEQLKELIQIDERGNETLNGEPIKGRINNLAKSDWVDGQPLRFFANKNNITGDLMIKLKGKNSGQLGRVPDQISNALEPLFADKEIKKDLKVELSNVVAGMSKGAPTIGLRVNMLYTGTDAENREKVQKTFNEILNDPDCKEKVMLYQQKTSPDEVLKMILNHETQVNGSESAEKMTQAISNIAKELNDPKNKNILLVGHCKPDGDTLGCILSLKNALGIKYPEKQVDCAVDDKVPGLFRHNLPGIDGEIKRPYNENQIEVIESTIKEIQEKPQDNITRAEIEMLKEEKKEVANPLNPLDPKKKYDLVIMMDIPTPERFSGAFKNYFVDEKGQPQKNSNGEDVKVIYIDHHTHRIQEWRNKQQENGVNMETIHKNGLSWIADAVPAATQLVTILVNKMIPDINKIGSKEEGKLNADEVFKKPGQLDKLKAFVAATVTGMNTDTGSFLRTANLLPEHMLIPVQQRPNFMPEGLSKWLMCKTDGISGKIDKKWLREEISYDLDDKKIPDLPLTAREKMLEYSVQGKIIPEDKELGVLGLGIVQVDYDQMFNVWDMARKSEKAQGQKSETTLLDVQNGFKYGEVISAFRSDPALQGGKNNKPADKPADKHSIIEARAKENYSSDFDNDRIAVLICQDKKEGFLDEKLNIATQNGLRLSLRSQDGTIYAELLGQLFGGGGHGGASGGRIDLPGVNLNTRLGVEINGQKTNSAKEILAQLKHNHEIMNDKNKSDNQKQIECKEVKVVLDDSGKSCSDLITDLTIAIRKEKINKENENKKAA